MKVLHSAVLGHASSGIYHQMMAEHESAKNLGLKFTTRVFCSKETYPESEITVHAKFMDISFPKSKLGHWLKLRYEYYKWLWEQQDSYDVIILRYSVHDLFLLKFLKNARIPIYTVHHTLEVPELKGMGSIGKARALAEQLIGPISIQYTTGIIGVTKEITQYESSRLKNEKKITYVYPNGINIKETKVIEDLRSNVPQLLFIASYFADWHGLDLLLKDLCNNHSSFILHVVGKTSEYQRSLANNDKRIVFHGHMSKKEINELASFCTLGLSSFALHRQNMIEACTLKVREYLALGLPVYSGHRDIFPSDFEYYYYGPPSFNEIIKYCNNVEKATRLEVRESSKHFINKDILLNKLFQFLETSYSTNKS